MLCLDCGKPMWRQDDETGRIDYCPDCSRVFVSFDIKAQYANYRILPDDLSPIEEAAAEIVNKAFEGIE